MNNEPRPIPPCDLVELVAAIFEHVGVGPAQSSFLAQSLVLSDSQGMHSHGVLRVGQYVRKIRAGGFKVGASGSLVRDSGSAALLDGDDGIGQLLSVRAMEIAIEKAKANSIGLCIVKNSNHHGASGFYARMATDQGMIGIVTSNGSPSAPVWGGINPRLTGPWPLAIAAPTTGRPVVLDMSLGVVSKGRVQHYADKGIEIPAGWGFDAQGHPTSDPQAVLAGGWSSFIGDYKGWGLLLMIEVLTGVLSGGSVADEIGDLFTGPAAQPQKLSHMMLAIDPGSVTDRGFFATRMEEFVRKMKASQLAPGVEAIVLPGEIEDRNQERSAAEGIVLSAKAVDELKALAEELGIPNSLPSKKQPAQTAAE